jgi:hypothetical protein
MSWCLLIGQKTVSTEKRHFEVHAVMLLGKKSFSLEIGMIFSVQMLRGFYWQQSNQSVYTTTLLRRCIKKSLFFIEPHRTHQEAGVSKAKANS